MKLLMWFCSDEAERDALCWGRIRNLNYWHTKFLSSPQPPSFLLLPFLPLLLLRCTLFRALSLPFLRAFSYQGVGSSLENPESFSSLFFARLSHLTCRLCSRSPIARQLLRNAFGLPIQL
ncbi:hypothetical protein BJX65DRAFT_219607 [Aspergillus insuetus]